MRRFSERADAEAVGARVPCADPKPPQIRKKIAQARVTVGAVGATEEIAQARVTVGALRAQPKMERGAGKTLPAMTPKVWTK